MVKKRFIQAAVFLTVPMLLLAGAACGSANKSTSTSDNFLQTPTMGQNITVPESPPNDMARGITGIVMAIYDNNLTLSTEQGLITVNVDDNTSYSKTEAATLDDLSEGQMLSISGDTDADGNISATSITIRSQYQSTPSVPPDEEMPDMPPFNGTPGTPPSGATSGPGFPGDGMTRDNSGTLTKINNNTLTMTTMQGQIKVNVSTGTAVIKTIGGTFDDISIGKSVTVNGKINSDGSMTAISVIIA